MSSTRIIAAAPALALCAAALASAAAAQGGWRQWDIYLRDGRRIEANPLGAYDDNRLATHVMSERSPDSGIPRSRIDYIAARTAKLSPPRSGVTLPPPPTGTVRRDLVVRLDGRRTSGRVTLKRVEWSEGVIVQNGVEIPLTDVAYIKFARPAPARARRPR